MDGPTASAVQEDGGSMRSRCGGGCVVPQRLREGEGRGGDQGITALKEEDHRGGVWAVLGRKTWACRPNLFMLITQVADPAEV